jgi:quercetin dioxygenase-like cupin family protein
MTEPVPSQSGLMQGAAPGPFGALDDLVPRALAPGVVTRLLSGSQMTFAYVELDPEVPVAEHSHANEQIGLLLSGMIEFRIDGELRIQSAGDTWIIPPHVPHGIDRTGPDGATIVEAFVPARPEYEELPALDPRPLRTPFDQRSES